MPISSGIICQLLAAIEITLGPLQKVNMFSTFPRTVLRLHIVSRLSPLGHSPLSLDFSRAFTASTAVVGFQKRKMNPTPRYHLTINNESFVAC